MRISAQPGTGLTATATTLVALVALTATVSGAPGHRAHEAETARVVRVVAAAVAVACDLLAVQHSAPAPVSPAAPDAAGADQVTPEGLLLAERLLDLPPPVC